MNRRSIITMMAVGVIGFCASSIAKADETLKFRIVSHVSSAQIDNVGDVEGHVLLVARQEGIAFLQDGSVAGAILRPHPITPTVRAPLWHTGTCRSTMGQRFIGDGMEWPTREGKRRFFQSPRSPSSAGPGNSQARRATAPRRARALRRLRSACISMPMSFSMLRNELAVVSLARSGRIYGLPFTIMAPLEGPRPFQASELSEMARMT